LVPVLVHDVAPGGFGGLVLVSGRLGNLTVGIFTSYVAGSMNEAAALGFILIVVAAVSLLAINKVAGTRMGGIFA
jgi:ABC-type Fe3+ transport system permease subunit